MKIGYARVSTAGQDLTPGIPPVWWTGFGSAAVAAVGVVDVIVVVGVSPEGPVEITFAAGGG